MAIKTRDQIKAKLTQCGGLSYTEANNMLDSVLFRDEIPPSQDLFYRVVVYNFDPITYDYGVGKVPIVFEADMDTAGAPFVPNGAPNYQYNEDTGILTLYPQGAYATSFTVI